SPAVNPAAEDTPNHEPLQTGEIRDVERFRELRPTWNRLVEASRFPSVFLRHEWFDAALQWASPRRSPLILTFSEGEAVVAVMPLSLQQPSLPGSGPVRLEALQVPDTQEFDLIARAGREGAACEAFARWLVRNRRHWDTLHLSALPSRSGMAGRLRHALAGTGIAVAPEEEKTNLSIDLTQPWESYYQGLSRRLKKNNNLIQNRLEKATGARLLWYRTLDAESQPLERAIAVSARSWKSPLGLSLDFPGPGRFVRRLADHGAREGWLSLWLLELDGEAAAMELQLAYGGRVHALRGDFDPDFESLSPGSYLHHHQLRSLFEEKDLTTYLMGPGPNPYKLRWSGKGETLRALRAWSPTWRGTLARLYDLRLWPAARRAKAVVTNRKKKEGA
ncbi:GNAT family N-acetyltransferase, partial [Thiohalorhabdus sp.]|uniref:GNAT family N-acetyltransferase n=1 Tax=Thiohalorhabdus sp. TaxID=3094134 RepID=UPI002FC289EE